MLNMMKIDMSWRIPYPVFLAVILFLFVNMIVMSNLSRSYNEEGYSWRGAFYIPVNSYEDDGRFNVYAALGYKDFDRHKDLINIGGPYIHIARFFLFFAEKAGIVKIFEDPYAYYLYPIEYLKIWKFYGFYKLFLFLIWMPIVVYWIGARHFSKFTGVLAAWFIVLIPFITAFETRIKADSVAITIGLFSILWQLEYLKNYKRIYLFLASTLLGVSLAVKFTMFPLLATLLTTYVYVNKKIKWVDLLKVFIIIPISFIIANPLAIKGFLGYLINLFQFINVQATQSSASPGFNLYPVWYRIRNFDSYYGAILNLFVIPSVAFALARMFLKKVYRSAASNILILFLFGYFIYIFFTARTAFVYLTYYFYAAAIVELILIAEFFRVIFEWVTTKGKIAACGGVCMVVFVLSAAGYENFCVLKYITSKTNRQEMYLWFEKNVPYGSTIGIPMDPTHTYFNSLLRFDPFKYRIVHMGKNGELFSERQPDYFVWIVFSKDESPFNINNYKLIKEFAKGSGLPHERYDLYQEEVFRVYRNLGETMPLEQYSSSRIEYTIGEIMRGDQEDEFRILQFQGLTFMPLWLNLMRKKGPTIDYDSHWSFEKHIRTDKQEYTRYAFIHDIDPKNMQLWGVKYILAKISDSSFETDVLFSNRYNFKEINRFRIDFEDGEREVGLFYNNEYTGQIFFAKYENNNELGAIWGVSGKPSDKNFIEESKINQIGGSAVVCTDSSGEIVFSLPYHKYWNARVDGSQVPVKEGPGGTVAVEINTGKHVVELQLN